MSRRDSRLRRVLLAWLALSLALIAPLQRVPAAAQQGCDPAAVEAAKAATHAACCYEHGTCGDLCHDVCSGMSVPAMPVPDRVAQAPAALPVGFAYRFPSKDVPPVPLNPPPISALA